MRVVIAVVGYGLIGYLLYRGLWLPAIIVYAATGVVWVITESLLEARRPTLSGTPVYLSSGAGWIVAAIWPIRTLFWLRQCVGWKRKYEKWKREYERELTGEETEALTELVSAMNDADSQVATTRRLLQDYKDRGWNWERMFEEAVMRRGGPGFPPPPLTLVRPE